MRRCQTKPLGLDTNIGAKRSHRRWARAPAQNEATGARRMRRRKTKPRRSMRARAVYERTHRVFGGRRGWRKELEEMSGVARYAGRTQHRTDRAHRRHT